LDFSSIFDVDFFDIITRDNDCSDKFKRFGELIKFSLLVGIGKEITSVIKHSASKNLFAELSKKYLPKNISGSPDIKI
jgi:hypothetical protein